MKEDKRTKELPQIIPPHSGNRELQSYQISELIFDATGMFYDQFISKWSVHMAK